MNKKLIGLMFFVLITGATSIQPRVTYPDSEYLNTVGVVCPISWGGSPDEVPYGYVKIVMRAEDESGVHLYTEK